MYATDLAADATVGGLELSRVLLCRGLGCGRGASCSDCSIVGSRLVRFSKVQSSLSGLGSRLGFPL